MKNSIFLTLLSFVLNLCVVGQSKIPILFETKDYQILFPGKYSQNTQNIPSKLGSLTMTSASYEPSNESYDSNYVYVVMESQYPDSTINSNKPETVDIVFKGSIDGVIVNTTKKLISERKGFLGIYPTRTIEIDYQNRLAIIKMTMILRGSKMIIIQTITKPENYPNLSSGTFFNSFTLK